MIEHYAIVDRDSTPERMSIWIWSKEEIKPGFRFDRDGYKGTVVEIERIKMDRGVPIYCVIMIPSGYPC